MERNKVRGRKLNKKEISLLSHALSSIRRGENFGGGKWIDLSTKKIVPRTPSDQLTYIRDVEALRVVEDLSDKTNICIRFQNYKEGKCVGIVNYTYHKKNIIVFVNSDNDRICMLEYV